MRHFSRAALAWTVNRVDPIPQLKRDAGAVLARAFANWSAHDVAAMIGTDAQRVMEIRRGGSSASRSRP